METSAEFCYGNYSRNERSLVSLYQGRNSDVFLADVSYFQFAQSNYRFHFAIGVDQMKELDQDPIPNKAGAEAFVE